jgi:hypothetical protein
MEWITDCIASMRETGTNTIEVTPQAQDLCAVHF